MSQNITAVPRGPITPAAPLYEFVDPSIDVASLSDSDKRDFIAKHGVPLRLPIGFTANNGVGVHPYPPSIAPPVVIEVHIAKLLSKGKGILLPLTDAQRLCTDSGMRLHVSNAFLQPKLNAILMRFIIDYTNPRGAGINHPDKSHDLARMWTSIRQPTAADICQLLVNAQSVFDGEELHGIRVGIDNAYPRRLLLHLLSVSLCAVLVVVEGVSYVYFPLVSTFGIQDVNFAFQLVTMDIDSRSQARDIARSQLPTHVCIH